MPFIHASPQLGAEAADPSLQKSGAKDHGIASWQCLTATCEGVRSAPGLLLRPDSPPQTSSIIIILHYWIDGTLHWRLSEDPPPVRAALDRSAVHKHCAQGVPAGAFLCAHGCMALNAGLKTSTLCVASPWALRPGSVSFEHGRAVEDDPPPPVAPAGSRPPRKT